MLWAQAGVSFLLWLAYGVRLQRRVLDIRAKLVSRSRTQKVLMSSVMLLGGMLLLLLGLYTVSALGGMREKALVPWAWVAVTALGVAFIHIQVLGAVAMVALTIPPETKPTREASKPQEKTEP